MDRRNGIVSYLTITFSVSWICWLVVAFLTQFTNVQLFSPIALPLYSLGAAGPLIGACVVNKRSLNNVDFRRYIKNIFNLKQPIFAYVSMIGLAWCVCFFPVLVGATQQQAPIYTALFQLPVMIFFGGGLEEAGWRGYLLPQLQRKFSSFTATCLVAFIWTFWHLPLWLVKGSGLDTIRFGGYMVTVFSFAFLLSFLWNKYGSIALCILLHAGFNSFTDVYPPSYNNLVNSTILLIICCTFFMATNYVLKKNAGEKTMTAPKG